MNLPHSGLETSPALDWIVRATVYAAAAFSFLFIWAGIAAFAFLGVRALIRWARNTT